MSTSVAEDRATAKLFDSLKSLEDDGGNYSTWKYRQLQIFDARNLMGHVDGSVKEPDRSSVADYDKWRKNEQTARMQITMHVGEAVLSHIMDKLTAHDMWNAVTAKFGGKGAASAANLIRSICQIRENVLAVMLVNLLPDSYSTVRTILTNSAIKDIELDTVMDSVLAEEGTRKQLNANAFKARADPKSKQKKGKGNTRGERPKCTNPKCGKVGHTIETCWAEGGGAEGKGPKSKPNVYAAKPSDAKARVAHVDEPTPSPLPNSRETPGSWIPEHRDTSQMIDV